MIRLHGHGSGVFEATLDRPDKRNALTPGMLANLAECARRAHAEGARALLLSGDGPAFCAGFDLSLCRDDHLAMADLLRGLSAAVRALRRAPMPVVAAAHGAAVAGGCALLGGADVVVTDDAATLGYPVVRLGVSPAVSSPTLRQSLGEGWSRERLLDPGLITGAEAARIGLAHERVARPEDVRPRAMEIAQALAAKPPHALAQTKLWLNRLDGSHDDAPFAGALAASLSLAGGAEERALLAALWARKE